MQQVSKTKTYLGFAIKSASIVFGYDNIVKKSHKIKLIIACSLINEKTLNNIKKLNKPLIRLVCVTLSELLERDNVKVVGLTNENLSQAILNDNSIFEKLN